MPPDEPGLSLDPEVARRGVRKGALLAGVIFVVVLADYLSKECRRQYRFVFETQRDR